VNNVIQFPTKRKGNATIKLDAKLNLAEEVEQMEVVARMQRIQDGLKKINRLFQELKESANETK
jgi:hypothetical protein